MSKIHIALVGGQLMPIYNGIVYDDPNHIIYIVSNESHNDINTLKKCQKEFFKDIPSTTIKIDTVNINEILQQAEKLKEQYANDQITINVTGGAKLWGVCFSLVFYKESNAKIIFIDQNNYVHIVNNNTVCDKVQFNMFVQFALNRNPLEIYKNLNEYTQEDFNNIQTIEEIRRINKDIFLKLTGCLEKGDESTLSNNTKGKFTDKKSNSAVSWNKKDHTVHFIIDSKKHGIKEFDLQSPNIVDLTFNFHWFEIKIARILSKWDKIKNIYVNCIFPSKETPKKYNIKFPKNEIDILAETQDKLLFVECKTNSKYSTDIDKFNTVVKNYGGIGSKKLFITENNMGDTHIEKCKELGMLHFSLSNKNKQEDYINNLFSYLDKNLYSINK